MSTIIINAITHREACLAGSVTDADADAYDEVIGRFFERLGEEARAHGLEFEVDDYGHGAASYRVTDEADYHDLQAAHDFMQSPAADFWARF